MRRLLLISLAVMLGTTAIALAAPGSSDVPPHRHFVQKPDGTLVQVGPRVCDRPALQPAFNRFHTNVHVPGAHGLHNHRGAEITARGCAFVAP